ncbi:MAG TPA: hypothetical protein DEF34_11015 [Desulfotomaculum sp.]|nr:MAG: hypothetical protein VR67_14200 [Peptococcaceae bacterium BRH_c8a]KJS74095.1 MAG: hypothetical protein JL56_09795 [Desulfotomaculum sp. BICA1-6]HBX24142.1 hypothetical protein [Desulfotomaculum sp.]
MTSLTNKAVIASLGVFFGLVIFGVSVSLTHFNRLVDPQHPLQLLEWQLQKEQLGLRLLGENLLFHIDREHLSQLAQQMGDQAKPVMYEISELTGAVKHEVSASNWPEKAISAAHEAGYIMLDILNKFKQWLWG